MSDNQADQTEEKAAPAAVEESALEKGEEKASNVDTTDAAADLVKGMEKLAVDESKKAEGEEKPSEVGTTSGADSQDQKESKTSEGGSKKAEGGDGRGQELRERQFIQLPPKLLPQEPRRWTNVTSRTRLLLNSYRMDVSKAEPRVYKHELKFWGARPPRGPNEKPQEPKDLSVGPKNDVAKHLKRQLCVKLFQQLTKQFPETFTDEECELIYDTGVGLYAYRPIVPYGERKIFQLKTSEVLEALSAYPEVENYLRPLVNVIATVMGVGEASLRHLSDAVEHDLPDRSALHFLDILMDQEIIRREKHIYFANKHYSRDSMIKLDNDPRIVKAGMEKDIRFVGDSIETAGPIIQFDPKKSAFFPEIPINEFLEQLLQEGRRGPAQNLEQMLNVSALRRIAERQIKSLIVCTTHLTSRRGGGHTFECRGFTKEACKDKMFRMRDGTQVSVRDYIEQTYQMRLEHPDLPCIVEKKPKAKGGGMLASYYPMEVIKIVANQRIPLEKQTPSLVQLMLRKCTIPPSEYPAAIEEQRRAAVIQNDNQFLKRCGVRLPDAERLMRTDAEVLFPPAINYGTGQPPVEPTRDGILNWKLGASRFARPTAFPKVWCCVLFRELISGDEMQRLVQLLIQAGKERGIEMPPMARGDVWVQNDLQFLREQFKFYMENKVGFVFFVARDDKHDPTHHRMKLMEAETGIVTQHISPLTARKAIGDPRRNMRPSPMVRENLMMKTNLKLGGINHNFHMPREFARANQLTKDIISQWLHPSRMFMGLEMSHPGAQSRHDRTTGVTLKDPSVVGCAYTVGHPVRTIGTYWMQETRVAYITNLRPQVEEALRNYRRIVGRWPKHLFVYRGGISEGEYKRVLVKEKSAFDKAFEALAEQYGKDEERPFKPPHLTMVVVQHASNYRLIPEKCDPKADDRLQNVLPGTCIDKRIMNPNITEFLLVPHAALKGTARSIRCTVIADTTQPERLSLEELENVTNILCYAHGIVTSPVSDPSPLHSASNLAKRGNNNWKMANYDGEDATVMSAREAGMYRPDPEEAPHHFWVRVTGELAPIRAHDVKFWA